MMCQPLGVISIALAVLLGLALFPVVLVFGPVYFPWSLFVLWCFGGVVGFSSAPHGRRSQIPRALGLSVLMLAVVLGPLALSSNVVFSRDYLGGQVRWVAWLLFPILIGVFAGASLRAKTGIGRGAVIGVSTVLAIGLLGVGLAFAFAPPEVTGAPVCDRGLECQRTWCGYMAERTRVLAIERVTAFDGERITCTYTTWGGITIGRAEIGRGGGSWIDGAWPEIVSGRGH
jgi:hypothetical protein